MNLFTETQIIRRKILDKLKIQTPNCVYNFHTQKATFVGWYHRTDMVGIPVHDNFDMSAVTSQH